MADQWWKEQRALSAVEKEEWLGHWLIGGVIGSEIFALAQALIQIRRSAVSFQTSLLLEAALVHQRCLLEFFIGRSIPKGPNTGGRRWSVDWDVTPAAMTSTWDPMATLGVAVVDSLARDLDDIDKRLAHPSKKRVGLFLTTWDVAPLTISLFSAADAFLQHLDSEGSFYADCLASWVAGAKDHLSQAGVSLDQPILVHPTSGMMMMVPRGQSGGRASAILLQSQAWIDAATS